jgi:hypothetical protein
MANNSPRSLDNEIERRIKAEMQSFRRTKEYMQILNDIDNGIITEAEATVKVNGIVVARMRAKIASEIAKLRGAQ